MIAHVLFCILWSRPEVKLVEVPVSEYAMAKINEDFGNFVFAADVIEDKMNSVKITYKKDESSTDSYAPGDYQQRTLSVRLKLKEAEASLECEVKAKNEN